MSVKRLRRDLFAFTRSTRTTIGFAFSLNDWRKAITVNGDHALNILGHPVMEDWEDPYMSELARIATLKCGRILELGYGMGISARYIQSYPIAEHIIIEANEHVAAKAREFAQTASHPVTVLEGFWQDQIDYIESASVDGILFDTYPLSDLEIHRNHYTFFPQAFRILKPGGILTYYSDEIDTFSDTHMDALAAAGFPAENVSGVPIAVSPPPDCEYWQSNTILAPLVTKPIDLGHTLPSTIT